MIPSYSGRVIKTDAPIIVRTKQLMATHPGTISLAQGIVSWPPPPYALSNVGSLLQDGGGLSVSQYGPAMGNVALCSALKEKLKVKNNLLDHEVMVTAGANQACVNAVIALVDDKDSVLLFKPYYFNHLMALQMTNVNCELGLSDPVTLHPDLNELEKQLEAKSRIKMVIMTNPSNPSGTLLSKEEVERLVEITRKAGVWLLMDETYEDFCFDGRKHYSPDAAHCLHVFSYSKAAGMMGWRVGYLAWQEKNEELGRQLLKVQDTVAICANQLAQNLALAVMAPEGQVYISDKIAGLKINREMVRSALSSLPQIRTQGGEGAIYFWVSLPSGYDDVLVYEWLVKKHKVCVIPGSSCGLPGGLRVAFANLNEIDCQEASKRLQAGLVDLFEQGPQCLVDSKPCV
jgi:aspartate/methionine/tyrosine aminotransferase